MAYLRRGRVRVPRKLSDAAVFTRPGGMPIRVYFKDISCWEEHQINPKNTLVFIYFTNASMISVTETFEQVDQLANGSAVTP